MAVMDSAEVNIALVALGRSRDSFPVPGAVDVVARKLAALAGASPKALDMYEMAQGSPLSARSALIGRLVDGDVIDAPKALSAGQVLDRAQQVVLRRRVDAWMDGYFVDQNNRRVPERPDGAGPAEPEDNLLPQDRPGPRLGRFLKAFPRIVEAVERATGLPGAWLTWEFNAEWYEQIVGQVLDGQEVICWGRDWMPWFVSVQVDGDALIEFVVETNALPSRSETRSFDVDVTTLDGADCTPLLILDEIIANKERS